MAVQPDQLEAPFLKYLWWPSVTHPRDCQGGPRPQSVQESWAGPCPARECGRQEGLRPGSEGGTRAQLGGKGALRPNKGSGRPGQLETGGAGLPPGRQCGWAAAVAPPLCALAHRHRPSHRTEVGEISALGLGLPSLFVIDLNEEMGLMQPYSTCRWREGGSTQGWVSSVLGSRALGCCKSRVQNNPWGRGRCGPSWRQGALGPLPQNAVHAEMGNEPRQYHPSPHKSGLLWSFKFSSSFRTLKHTFWMCPRENDWDLRETVYVRWAHWRDFMAPGLK